MSEPSKIAYGVSRESSKNIPFYADYKVSCGCGHRDHDISIDFEHDGGIVWLTFHKRIIWSCYWGTRRWYQSLKRRFLGAFTLFFRGWLEFEETFILDNVEHIDGFILALQEGKQRLLAYCEKIEKEK